MEEGTGTANAIPVLIELVKYKDADYLSSNLLIKF